MSQICWSFGLIFVSVMLSAICEGAVKENVYTIGTICDNDCKMMEGELRLAVEMTNGRPWLRKRTRLMWETAQVSVDDGFNAYRRLCNLLTNDVALVIGPSSPKSSFLVESACSSLSIPHVAMYEDFRIHKNDLGVNLYPRPTSLAKVVAATVLNWDRFRAFTILYQGHNAFFRVQELLKLTDCQIFVYELVADEDTRPLLKKIKATGHTRMVIDADIKTITDLFEQLAILKMMNEYYEYIVVNYDFHTIDLSAYRSPAVNITGFQIIDPTIEEYKDILSRWRLFRGTRATSTELNAPEQTLTTEVALLYDAVTLLATVTTLSNTDVQTTSCNSTASKQALKFASEQGMKFASSMRGVNVTGITGPIFFDKDGFRSSVNIHVIKSIYSGLIRIATWNGESGLFPVRSAEELRELIAASLAQKEFLIVTTSLNPPLFMLKDEPDDEGAYEGYVMDLVHELENITEYKFKVRPVIDNKYGDNDTGKWNGMVGELIEMKADLAIADLAMTQIRQDAVDFTIPFMNLGIGILFKKASKTPPSLFSFLNPFSEDVWIYMVTACLGVSLTLFFLARLSPYEWDNPHPCDSEPEELENQFNLMNSLWFVVGSLMQQGCDILPKAVSTRTVAGVWWFFNMIVVATYTANLAAFLTSDRMAAPITSAADLAKQSKIKYGCVVGGATMGFFKRSQSPIFKDMWRFMSSADPSVFVGDNTEGIHRVLRGDYAFFMETTFIEYQTVRNCELMQVGGALDSKGYGVGLRKGSPYYEKLNLAVLRLQDRGALLKLKKRWWQEKGGDITCPPEETDSLKLGIANVGGVFVLVTGGLVFAIFVGVMEFVWFTHKNVREQKVPVWKEMRSALKFAVYGENTKPIVKSASESESGIALAAYSSAVFGKDPLTT